MTTSSFKKATKIKLADKGGATVILDTGDYIMETMKNITKE